jgi:hypothetical protein
MHERKWRMVHPSWRSALLKSRGMMSWSNQFMFGTTLLPKTSLATFRRGENAVLKVFFGARSAGREWWLPPHVGEAYALVEDRENAGWESRRVGGATVLQQGDAALAAKLAYDEGPNFFMALKALFNMPNGECAVAELLRPEQTAPRHSSSSTVDECSW